jgi:hypothetical protein
LASACIVGCTANEKKSAETDKDGFVSIFDGKTLKGWKALPAETAPAWTVKDGMIVGDGDKGRGYLTLENTEIADLEIKLSCISIRARDDKTGKRHFQAYHADFGHVGIGKKVLGALDFHTPGRKEHACFRGDRLVIDENDRPEVTKIEGTVTTEDIKKGGKFFINGKLSSEFTEHLPAEKRLDKGMIQLQLHDPGMIVHFKDIRLKILK